MEYVRVDARRFTCSGCLVAFADFESHRIHYQSEWHRFNQTRRSKSLPPVTLSKYEEALATMSSADSLVPKRCRSCNVLFKTETGLQEHEGNCVGKRMRDLCIDDLEAVLKKRLEENRLDVSVDCLFCDAQKFEGDMEMNLKHMEAVHGLYIPDRLCVCNMKGLLQYLADKMTVGYCLYCADGKSPFASIEAVRQHMADKGHLKIRFDEEGSGELCEFYDWDELFEDVSDGEQINDSALLTPDGTELVLPSGSRLGNRAYYKYYKQYLRPYSATDPDDEEMLIQRRERAMGQQLLRMRGQDGRVAETQRIMDQSEKREQRSKVNHLLGQRLALGVHANKFQPHFRPQTR